MIPFTSAGLRRDIIFRRIEIEPETPKWRGNIGKVPQAPMFFICPLKVILGNVRSINHNAISKNVLNCLAYMRISQDLIVETHFLTNLSNTNVRSKRQYRIGGEASRPLRQGTLEINAERTLV